MFMFIGDVASAFTSSGGGGLFSGDGWFAKAARKAGDIVQGGAEFVASLPNEVIDFGRDLGRTIFGGAQSASEGVTQTFEEQGREFAAREAPIQATGWIRSNLPIIGLALVAILILSRR